jgi:hypothetical protein
MKYITSYDQLKEGKYYLKYSSIPYVLQPFASDKSSYRTIAIIYYEKPKSKIMRYIIGMNMIDDTTAVGKKIMIDKPNPVETFKLTEIRNTAIFFELSEDEVNQNIILEEI